MAFVKTLLMNFAMALAVLPAASASGAQAERPKGAPENVWRYQFYNGRWWYWTPRDQWAFYDGGRWVTLSRARREALSAGNVGRAMQTPASGRLPVRTYTNFGASPFYSPLGQGPQNYQPVAPAAATGGISPTPGSAGGASELGISGSRSGDANSGVGGGSVGGTSVTGGIGQPTRP